MVNRKLELNPEQTIREFIWQVREDHVPTLDWSEEGQTWVTTSRSFCRCCEEYWSCSTIRLADALEVLMGCHDAMRDIPCECIHTGDPEQGLQCEGCRAANRIVGLFAEAAAKVKE